MLLPGFFRVITGVIRVISGVRGTITRLLAVISEVFKVITGVIRGYYQAIKEKLPLNRLWTVHIVYEKV